MIHRFMERDKKKALSGESMLRVIRGVVVTEKAAVLGQASKHVLEVAGWANKFQIRTAVETFFGVNVTAVNTLVTKGKVRRFKGRKGVKSDVKKAILTLEAGQTLGENLAAGGSE